MNTLLLRKLFTSIAFAAACLSLSASVNVTLSDAAPTDYFTGSSVGVTGLQWRNDVANGRRDLGQSFLSSADLLLQSITFRLVGDSTVGAGALNAAFTLSVYNVGAADGLPVANSAISTQQGVLTGLSGTTADFNKYVTFNLSDGVALSEGGYYAVILSFNDQAAARNLVWSVSNTGASYPDGRLILSTDGTTFSTGNDMLFYATGTAIPEPAAYASGIAVLILCVALLRRRTATRTPA